MCAATCNLCFHHCNLSEGEVGFCRARKGGEKGIVEVSSEKVTALALDPIEKKPLSYFHPNSKVLSFGSFGCNMRCPFCQNASIAQMGEQDLTALFMSPEKIVNRAVELRHAGCEGIAFTYNEPTTFYHFMMECAALAHENDLYTVLVSNGMIETQPLEALAPLIDAANIDLKCFTEEGYRKLAGDFETAKNTIATLYKQDVHVELTTLVVPGLNDSPQEFEEECAWIASIDKNIPLHITRFFPKHLYRNKPPTPRPLLDEFKAIAKKHLTRVQLGNV